jgi:hypothetical protein
MLSAVLAWLAACSAPDGSTLYRPLGAGGDGTLAAGGSSANGAAGGAPSGGVSASAGASGAPSSAGSNDEGQGGAMLINEDDGSDIAGSEVGGDGREGADAGADADGGAVDAGAVVVPPPCIPGPEVCDGLDNDCDDAIDPGDTCAAACVGFALAQHGYMYCADSLARATVLARCESEGMHLVWLETPGESVAVRDAISASGLDAPDDNDEVLTWIGGSDAADEGEWFWIGNGAIAGSFRFWTGGSPPAGGAVDGSYAAWSPGEPTGFVNEHCAAISVLGNALHDPGAWDDRSCNEALPYVCEAP